MRILLAYLITLIAGTAFAQSEADSLRLLIAQSNADTNRVKLLLDLGYFYEFEQRDSAIAIYERAFALADQLQSDLYRGKSMQYRSIVLHDQGLYAKSIAGYLKALDYFQKAGSAKGIAATQNNIANGFLYMADYGNAISYYLMAKPYYLKAEDAYSLVTLYGNIGECYRQLGEKELMLGAARESYRYALASGDSVEIANAGISLGSALQLNHQPDSSKLYLQQSLQWAERNGHSGVLFYALFDLADAELNSRNADKASALAQRALLVAQTEGDKYQETGAFLLLGRVLSQLNGKSREAEAAFAKGLELATSIQAADQRLLLMSALADHHEALGNDSEALLYRNQWIALNDSLFNAEKSRQISELHTLYGLKEKEEEIEKERLLVAERDKEISLRNLQVLLLLLLAVLLVVIAYFTWKSQRVKRKIAEQESVILQDKNERLLREQEAIQLKSLIDGQELERQRIARELHDGLGSYLTAVHLKVQQLPSAPQRDLLTVEISEMVATAGREMRKVSHSMSPEGLAKFGLISTVEQFVHQLSTPSCTISFESFGDPWPSNTYSELTVYRIIQELLHNVIKHSLASQAFVSISYLPEALHLVVEDNGQGFQTDKNTDGNGLTNLRARITYLNASLDLVSKPGTGTSFTIVIPQRHG